jgi:hypothetical protein
MSDVQAVIERAASDPDFLKRLAEDPVGTAHAENLAITTEDLKGLLEMSEASDEEAVEALQARLSHSSGARASMANAGFNPMPPAHGLFAGNA